MRLSLILSLLLVPAVQACGIAAQQSLPSSPPPPVGLDVIPADAPVMRLKRSAQEQGGEPLWILELGDQRFWAVTGRSNRQADELRHTSGTRSPLPAGTYRVHAPEQILPGDPVELGRSGWIALTPQFATGRSALGIHHDPSFGKDNGESGTDGCIGMLTADDMEAVMQWVQENQPRRLIVES